MSSNINIENNTKEIETDLLSNCSVIDSYFTNTTSLETSLSSQFSTIRLKFIPSEEIIELPKKALTECGKFKNLVYETTNNNKSLLCKDVKNDESDKQGYYIIPFNFNKKIHKHFEIYDLDKNVLKLWTNNQIDSWIDFHYYLDYFECYNGQPDPHGT